MDAELSAALIMFDDGDPTDLETDRQRLRDLYDADTPRIPDAVRVRDVQAAPPLGPPVRVRLYEPRVVESPLPALLWLHGGAFSHGFAELDDDLCFRMAADAGFVVLSPDYRLSPEHPFPAGFDDAYATLTWLAGQADVLGIDSMHIGVRLQRRRRARGRDLPAGAR